MTATTNPVPCRVSHDCSSLTASAAPGAGVSASASFLGELAERHDRLAQATERAPHGQKLRYLSLTRAACHERMSAELHHG